jgi:thiosulfate/3-mercaptopyruvate sulfurtransferase
MTNPSATNSYTTLISATELQALQASGTPLMVFDCSFDLMNPAAGPAQFAEAHLPGAVYMHLDHDLSDKSGQGQAASGGRHPLPSREAFAQRLRERGFQAGMQAVVYERQGANFCGRLWWMLKWCGHEAVAVLDGGLAAWQSAGGPLASGAALSHGHGNFALGPSRVPVASAHDVLKALGSGRQTVVDARATARFKGEVEPLDPVAGHIPGALNRPFTENFLPDGRFRPATELRAAFDTLLAGRPANTVVHQCGSGVSAVPNLLAMEVAGLGRTTLFPGSWSEWCQTPGAPGAKG